jgi:hypothetical protein
MLLTTALPKVLYDANENMVVTVRDVRDVQKGADE